ncbi:MAG: ASCH domain-containing protein [Phycisphaerae bacterium]
MTHHLVILQPRYINAILSGGKSIECRLSRHRIEPFGAVHRGDTLWLKHSGGLIVARARVRSVAFFTPATGDLAGHIASRYGDLIKATPQFFRRHRNARYATIIHIGRVDRLQPFGVLKSDRRAWVVLSGPPNSSSPVSPRKPRRRQSYTK